MKIIRERTDKRGIRIVTVELRQLEKLRSFAHDHYRLGDPHNEIVHADKITDACPVTWCDLEQKWIDV